MSDRSRFSPERRDELVRLSVGLGEPGTAYPDGVPEAARRADLHLDGYRAGEDLQLDRLLERQRSADRDRPQGGPERREERGARPER